jgi:hypothetical protein
MEFNIKERKTNAVLVNNGILVPFYIFIQKCGPRGSSSEMCAPNVGLSLPALTYKIKLVTKPAFNLVG